ncbi:MAG: hypothetical protein QOG62_748 [Thermoleophilaceae bacterium]|jgi:hypothetical protein|nr:hypothetical protein [Thermoleophilaceae bacterium]
MARTAQAGVVLEGEPEGLIDRWRDTTEWPHWVDGCARVVEVSADWPAAGSTVAWQTRPGGRGTVREEVLAAESRRFATRVEDQSMTGTQTFTIATLEDGSTRLGLELEYTLPDASVFQSLMDALFIRRAFRDSLQRTLERFTD